MSSFTYTTNIPDAPNNPSNDQPIMRVNTNSIDSLIAVDHVGFNVSGGGQHEQVTVNSNNVPSIPTSPPVLFTNNDAFSTPQLFFYSGATAKTSDQYRLDTNGSTYCFGGIIIKWGTCTVGSGGGVVTYSSLTPAIPAFPNSTFSVVLTPKQAATTFDYGISSFNSSSFTVSTNTPNGKMFNFFAIGN